MKIDAKVLILQDAKCLQIDSKNTSKIILMIKLTSSKWYMVAQYISINNCNPLYEQTEKQKHMILSLDTKNALHKI